MAIKVISPVNLDEGHLVKLDANGQIDTEAAVLGGQVVKLVTSSDAQYGGELHIEKSLGTDTVATATPYGFATKPLSLNLKTTFIFLLTNIKPL